MIEQKAKQPLEQTISQLNLENNKLNTNNKQIIG